MADKNILIITDPQVGFKNSVSENAFKIMQKILDNYGNKFDEVIITKFYNPENSRLKREKDWHRFDKEHIGDRELALKIPNNVECNIIEMVEENKLLNGLFRSIIEEKKDSKFFLCGVSTDCAILLTGSGLGDVTRNSPIIIEDACASNKEGFAEKVRPIIKRLIETKPESNIIKYSKLGKLLP